MFRSLFFNGFISQFTLYSSALYVSSLVNFLLLPLLIRFLSPHEFGIFENFIVTVTILAKLLLFGQDVFILKETSSKSSETRTLFWSSSVVLITYIFFIVLAFVFIDLLTYQVLYFLLKLNTPLLILAVIVSYCYAIFQLHSAILKLEENAKQNLILHLIRTLCDASLIIFLILFFSLSLIERTATYVLSFLITFLFSIVYLKKRGIFFFFDLSFFSFKTSIYVMGFAFCELGIQFIDRVMISHILTLSDTGIYSFSYRFSTVLLIVSQTIHTMWMSFYLKYRGNLKKCLLFFISTHILMFVFIVSYITFIWYLFPYLSGEQYQASFIPFVIVTSSYLFDLTWRLSAWPLLSQKKEGMVFSIYALSFILNILLNYILIQRYGIIGAAISTGVSLFFGALISLCLTFFYWILE